MKFTYSWLKDFVEIKMPPAKLAGLLTMAGIEVVGLKEEAGDALFEIEITSNRPDWLSVLGVAREVAALTGRKLKQGRLVAGRWSTVDSKKIKIGIESKKDCPLYTARVIEGVKVGSSPEWLRRRLEAIGCRTVNNIVDITNYILFTFGEPLHAFDLDKLPGENPAIEVRRARSGEKIIGIDGQTRDLTGDILVITSGAGPADQRPATSRPIAIAGIMGGKETEVGIDTRNILLEAAVFSPVLVRKGRQALGLQTDSSYRFERGIDPETALSSSALAAGLIVSLAGGKAADFSCVGTAKTKKEAIVFHPDFSHRILGREIPVSEIKNILQGLGFTLRPSGKASLRVQVPAFRRDISEPVDLVEEVARVFGYGRIPATLPKISPVINASSERVLLSEIKRMLLGLGLDEAITYSLIPDGFSAGLVCPKVNTVKIANPLSKEQEVLRPTVIPGLLGSLALNLNRRQEYIGLFEIGKVFAAQADSPREELSLGMVLCGYRRLFLGQGVAREQAGILHLKGIVETLCQRLGIEGVSFSQGAEGRVDLFARQEKAGVLFQPAKETLERFEIKEREVFAAELCLSRLLLQARKGRSFHGLPLYPGISRDISILISEGLSIDKVLAGIRESGPALLRKVEVTDYYKGKQVPQGWRSVTLSCSYRSDERTLTEAEINPLHTRLVELLTGAFGAKIR